MKTSLKVSYKAGSSRLSLTSGFGLHIVYNLIKQKLNGNISCESETGKGVLFILEVPVG